MNHDDIFMLLITIVVILPVSTVICVCIIREHNASLAVKRRTLEILNKQENLSIKVIHDNKD